MRRKFLKTLIGLSSIPVLGKSQIKTQTNPSPKQIASDLLKLANKIQSSQMSKSDRDSYSEIVESLSGKIVKDYNTGTLCSSDSDCVKKIGN